MKASLLYTISHPDGRISREHVPCAWSPYEVAEKYEHCLVFLNVPIGHGALVEPNGMHPGGILNGPAIVLLDRDSHTMTMAPHAPTSESDAFNLWKHYSVSRPAPRAQAQDGAR